MRIVLDTNVLVSGLLSPHGPPGAVVDMVLTGAVRLAFDDRILSEYGDVLRRERFGFDPSAVGSLLSHVRLAGVFVVAERLTGGVLRDVPDLDDLPFAEVTLAADADALVTGNARHFDFMARLDWSGQVLSPARFVGRGP